MVDYATTTVTRLADGTTQVEELGSVISGLDIGDNATQIDTLPNIDLSVCNTPSGLTSLSGPATTVFSSL